MDNRARGTLTAGNEGDTLRSHRFAFLRTTIKVIASAGLLVWLFARIDWAKVLDVMCVIPGIVFLSGLLLASLGQCCSARRLQILLHAQSVRISYGLSVRLTFMGLFAGNFLPSTIGGDAVKIVLLAREGFGKAISTLSIAADRLLSLLAYALLVPTVFATPRLVRLESIETSAKIVGVVALIGAVLLGVIVILAARFGKIAGASEFGLARRVMQLTSTIASGITHWATHPRDIFIALGLSLAATLAGIAAVWIQARPMDLSVSFIEFVAVYTLVYLATLAPVSLNGLGVQEVAFVYLLPYLGATPEQALALALIARFLQVATSLPGALLIMVRFQR